MRLLLIEDDATLGEGLRDFFRSESHRVDWCRRLIDVESLGSESYDAWLVDWQLPDGSGLAWVASQRERGDRTPAVMLTARDRLSDRIEGLDSGCDDYLVKPFAPEELSARLRAVTRRSGAQSARARAVIAGVAIDLTERATYVDGARVDLTAREWSVLEALVMRAGRIVGKVDLERIVMGSDAELSSNALEVHVAAIRRKLGHGLIDTVRGMGYRVGVPDASDEGAPPASS
jgi:two-component system, OmpR family, response regulator